MASLSIFLSLVLSACLLLPNAVHSSVNEDNILNAINNYRQEKNLSALIPNDNAACFADRLAGELRDQPCSSVDDFNKEIGSDPKLSNFQKLFNKCHIEANTTVDGVVLPVCVPKLEPNAVLNNFTRSDYVRYLNVSNYSGAGVGTADDWVVVVLSTNTSTGSFTSAASLVAGMGALRCLTAVFLGLYVSLLAI